MRHDDRARLYREKNKLVSLLWKEEKIKIEIAKTKRNIAALFHLVHGDDEDAEYTPDVQVDGLTDSIRDILRAAGKRGIAPMDIRSELTALGFQVNDYKNILASIHTVLGRLVLNDGVTISEGKYFWRKSTVASERAEYLVRFKEANKRKTE
jgi:hypothetical protein